MPAGRFERISDGDVRIVMPTPSTALDLGRDWRVGLAESDRRPSDLEFMRERRLNLRHEVDEHGAAQACPNAV